MRSSTFATFALLVAAVSAQTPAQLAAQIPACVLPCDTVAIAAVGCGEEDYACHCARSAQIAPLARPCLQSSSNCTAAELTKFATLAAEICVALNATTNATTTVSSTITTPAPTGSASVSPIPYTGDGARSGLGNGGVIIIGLLAAFRMLL